MTGNPIKDPQLDELASRALIADLRSRLEEAEETLDAIRNGEVDAIVTGGPTGQQVYTLENADRPYRVLIEQMQEGAITATVDGTILYCNERFADIVNRPREKLLGENALQFFNADDARIFRGLLGRGRDRRAAGEFTLQVDGGSEVPVNISLVDLMVDEGMPRIVCGVITDLTQNRQRGRELARANERLGQEIGERRRAEDSLRLALDAAEMGSWNIDLVADQTQRSRRQDQIFGIDSTTVRWKVRDALSHVIREDRERVAGHFRQAMREGAIEFEARIRRANDGAIRWIAVKGQTFYASGKPVRVAGVVSDVTERREVDEQLRQAQKMEAVGQLTGGIAHDFNNLLMVIGGSLDVLARVISVEGNVKRLLEAAQRSVERGAKLNQQLLTFSRRQDLRAEVICVSDLIPGFEHLIDRALGETIEVRVELAPQLWHCRTDSNQLETAILNLAINARDAMPDGGTLTLKTENRRLSAAMAARWGASAGEYVVVSVADNGSGMSAETIKRAFEPFFTTKAIGKGTGLGLSQVYGFVKQSGGFVTIDSELGVGTRVAIHLQRVDIAIAAQNKGVAEPAQALARGTVLVVDDDIDVRLTTRHMLSELGYTVREADSGPAALESLANDPTVNVVFSDVIMPAGMSGIELAREIKRRWPQTPVLLTSGYTAQRMIPDASSTELPLLRKPFSLGELSQAILETLHQDRS